MITDQSRLATPNSDGMIDRQDMKLNRNTTVNYSDTTSINPDMTRFAIAIRSNLSRQNFQRDFAIKFRVWREINPTHPARAEV